MPECPPGVHSIFDPCPGNCTEPVDEYDELFDELWSMEYRITGDKPRAMKFAREFLARHAHFLAERVRTAVEGLELDDHWAVYYAASDVEAMADEIDPGVTS